MSICIDKHLFTVKRFSLDTQLSHPIHSNTHWDVNIESSLPIGLLHEPTRFYHGFPLIHPKHGIKILRYRGYGGKESHREC